VIKLEEFDYGGATVIATLMLATSFLILFLVNALQRRVARGQSH
jgi:sulfate transport system permease protein